MLHPVRTIVYLSESFDRSTVRPFDRSFVTTNKREKARGYKGDRQLARTPREHETPLTPDASREEEEEARGGGGDIYARPKACR
jgi:hypothetical protein